jgi:GGDEF domain-containing protein
MNIGHIGSWVHSHPSLRKETGEPNTGRLIALLAEGAARGMPEVDKEAYRQFRTMVDQLALQLPEPSPIEDKLEQIRVILHLFEEYRNNAATEIHERRLSWRAALLFVLGELLERSGVDQNSGDTAQLLAKIVNLTTAKEIRAFQQELEAFVHPVDAQGRVQETASSLKITDQSKSDDNAAGLPGGGSAVEHLQQIIDRRGEGFVAFFRLGCLNVIGERFGMEAIQDCFMEVAANLTHSLRGDDTIYHWSDSSLLAILQGRANERVARAELKRIVTQNRDIAIQVNGREIVLRIPLEFEVYPVRFFRSAEDLHHISPGVLLAGSNL